MIPPEEEEDSIKFGYNLNMKVFISYTYIYISFYMMFFGYALESSIGNLAIFLNIKILVEFLATKRKAQKHLILALLFFNFFFNYSFLAENSQPKNKRLCSISTATNVHECCSFSTVSVNLVVVVVFVVGFSFGFGFLEEKKERVW
jgi:hypothetical protein